MAIQTKQNKIESRKRRVRAKMSGTSERPRLSVFRSNKYFYAQIIDDEKEVTRAAATSQNAGKSDNSIAYVAQELWKKADKEGIKQVVFDRGPYRYTGTIKVFADAARDAGFEF